MDACRRRAAFPEGHNVTKTSCHWALQVRDFAFVPDDGRITALSYDTFGIPSIPEALLNVYEVRASSQPSP